MNNDNHLLAKIGQYDLIKNKKEQLLILERAKSKDWSLPGGRLSNYELWDEGFKREIKEEINLEASGIKPFAVNILTDPYQIKYCVYFDTSVKNIEEIKISPEHSNFKWIQLNEISEIKFEDQEILKIVSDFLNTSTNL